MTSIMQENSKMKSSKSQVFFAILAGFILSWGVVSSHHALCQENHPDYERRVAELLGKKGYNLKLSDEITLLLVGSPEEIQSGNYYAGTQLILPGNTGPKLFYAVRYEDNKLNWVVLSDGRMLNFRDGDPGDFVLTWRSIDPKKQRTYTAKYSGGELTGLKLQLGSNFYMEYDQNGNMIHAVFGESTNARRATYEEGEEFSVGAIGRHELYSRTGRRLVHSNYSKKDSKPQVQEYDAKQQMTFEVAYLDGESLEGIPITLYNIFKYNVELRITAEDTLTKTTTESDILGQIVSYKEEEGLRDKGTGEIAWSVITTDWEKSMKVPDEEMLDQLLKDTDPEIPGNNASALLDLGMELKESGEYDKAIVEYSRALEMEPGGDVALRAFHNRANCWYSKKDYERAIVDYTRALEIKSNAITYNNRGSAWKNMGEIDKAKQDFHTAIEQDPQNPDGYRNLGKLYLDNEEYKKATEVLSALIEIEPDNPYALSQRGEAWLNRNEHDKAIQDYSSSLQYNPENAYAWGQLGYIWKIKRDLDKAIVNFSKQLDLDPMNDWAFWQRARCWHEKKDNDRALADYTRALKIAPLNAVYYSDRGVSWNDKGDIDKALSDYSKAIEINPQDALAYNNRGAAWEDKGEYDKAIADYSMALELNPEYVLAYRNRGNIRSKNDEFQKAQNDYAKAIELNPNDHYSYYKRALLLEKMEEFGAALEDARKAVLLQPDNNVYKDLVTSLEAQDQGAVLKR